MDPTTTNCAGATDCIASKVLARKHGDDTCNEHGNSGEKGDSATDMQCSRSEIPGEPTATVLAKLNIKGIGNTGKVDDASAQQKGPRDVAERNGATNGTSNLAGSKASSSFHCNNNAGGEISQKINSSSEFRREYSNAYPIRIPGDSEENFPVVSSTECNGRHGLDKPGDQLQKLACQQDRNESELEASNLEYSYGVEDDAQRQPGGNFPSHGKSVGSLGSSSSKRDSDSNCISDCEIRWEDLKLGEEIGRGSFAAVYRGIWNGSDVAVKIYLGNQYKEETLLDYQKEIDIMKSLRHPNVLLFMGAVYSPERLAIVTEFLPRGSLFKTLHKNSPAMDIRRRVKMALDVARGMNYLHHRNPPILHRDLKSSNLLVDKNWTVKVGDFGLSKWKDAAFLTAKSGRGTPQWMAPEVLRNEPSNEKSDVFSFGVILWELMTVSVPWVKLNSLEVVGVVGFMDRRLELPESLDPKVASIISDCWLRYFSKCTCTDLLLILFLIMNWKLNLFELYKQ
ncbi:SERINE-THREONINE PROTEIN KINASE [Salix purpurea]|uniref:non-specific serine/threonine protein kinase n=1 Tax=Salix purpurea TaxID=77065 RepID=A0A9Q0QF99_SALPP|nr:SERINE-THREONINE PROTEIN KINASE [Salix purpurea]